SSSRQIAWKTGTSFGFRDAWAVGLTPEYVVAVWVGNASGEGRPGIVGGTAAGPILFELFNLLPATSRLQIPYDDLIEQETCSQSGERASSFCPNPVVTLIPNTVKKTFACPYHKLIHLSSDGLYRTSI
ncbi:MAG TPA: penicillin-binding protein 1C, partial [Marinilabiliaceae bacterium]|nr:penicillin-binding protein 1C [Marinilabiliaceae bacterium]